jgi:hypothetical protein
MNVPTALGCLSATFPMAVLEISGSPLIFRIRPRGVQALVGAQTLNVSAEDGTVLLPVDQLAGIGIGVRPVGQPAWYFRTPLTTSSPPQQRPGFGVLPTLGRCGR